LIADSTKAIKLNSTLTLSGFKINTVEELITVSFLKLGTGNAFEIIRRGIKWEVEGRAGENTYIVSAKYNGAVARMETEIEYDYIRLSPLTISIEYRNVRSSILDLWLQDMIMQSIQDL
jgi:hypothetical protein